MLITCEIKKTIFVGTEYDSVPVFIFRDNIIIFCINFYYLSDNGGRMNRKKLLNRTIIIGILTVWLAGSLFHFVYDWTGKNTIAGLFFPTNESTWEHMKLVFLPMNLYGLATWYVLKDKFKVTGFAVFMGIITGTWAIPFLYYTYMGVLGFSRMWLDIGTFFVAVLAGYAVEYHILRRAGNKEFGLGTWILAIADFVMAVAFAACSYNAPSLGIFLEP